MILIKNANVYTMDEQGLIENGYVIIDGDRISSVGSMNNVPDVEAEVIDADGGSVTPGFIDAHCHLGMWEDSLAFEGDDGNESTSPVTPYLRAIDGMNVCDVTFAESLSSGITTACIGPGSANPIAGMFSTLHTNGNIADKMLITPETAMKFSLGENPKLVHGKKGKEPLTRMGIAAMIREALYNAKNNKDDDFRTGALKKVVQGELPAKFHAHRADDICTAVRIAKEFGLKYSIEHATDALEVADYLKENKVPLNLGPFFTDRSKPEMKSLSIETPAKLIEKGFNIALISDHPASNGNLLPLTAAYLMKIGISEYTALETITVNAATNIGIENQYGTITPDKKSDILIFDGSPLQLTSKINHIFIDGIKIR
ncbi:MAG: amidohydrolase family protein [Clostridia bacterium]|nr:amidohydrolase family protein [Clostridia bacterium]